MVDTDASNPLERLPGKRVSTRQAPVHIVCGYLLGDHGVNRRCRQAAGLAALPSRGRATPTDD